MNILRSLKEVLLDIAKLRDKRIAAEVAALITASLASVVGVHLSTPEVAGVLATVAVVAAALARNV